MFYLHCVPLHSGSSLLPLIDINADNPETVSSEGASYIQICKKLIIGNYEYQLFTLSDITYINDNQKQLTGIFACIYIATVALAVIISWLISSRLLKPLSQLACATSELAAGNLSYRTDCSSKDELGALSEHFNSMASQIEEGMLKLEEDAEAKEQFMEAFSHELKTPMTSIIGYAELLQSQQLNADIARQSL